jgi:hypothetical protein
MAKECGVAFNSFARLSPKMAVNIGLVVTSVVFAILVMIGSFYFVVYYQHPQDKWQAWFPKGVVVNFN